MVLLCNVVVHDEMLVLVAGAGSWLGGRLAGRWMTHVSDAVRIGG